MLLKRLTVQGYKTFANKTEFLFDQGVTSIVGPNGSGKSNIADAVRWVLGEQSYGELRGKRTVDMIFAGSPSRPRAGMASAVLTLDNSEGWLPIDYAEVEIGRRAYRTGENEYYLNGSRVRLKDVRELLATSGLAQRTYTMIGQGLVDRALSLKADERRALFEEAAGISHYKDRRAETLRRLNETQRNIERVQDVLAEIEPRLRSLKRQANRAENFESVQVELRELLRVFYGYHWEAAKVKLRLARAEATTSEAAWKESRRKLIAISEQMEESRKRLGQYQSQLNTKSAERDSLREQVEHARRQVAILTERQSLVSRQLGEIDIELPDLEAQLERAQAELTSSTNDLSEIQAQLDGDRAELQTFEKSFQTKQAAIDTQQKLVARLAAEFQSAQRRSSQSDGQLEQLRERLAERERESVDSADLERTRAEIADFTTQVDKLKAESKTFNEARSKARGERESLIRDLKASRRTQHELAQTANRMSKSVAKLEARADLLDQMRQKAGKVKGKAETLGTIANLVKVPTEYQTAIEAAVSARLSALIVPNAKNLWQLLDDNDKDSLSALVVEDARARNKPYAKGKGVVGVASDLVKYKKKDAAIVEALLNPIVVVDDRKIGRKLSDEMGHGVLVVTMDGLIFHPNGIVEQTSGSGKNSAVAQENAFQEAKGKVEKEQAALTEANDSAEKARAEIDKVQAQANELNSAEEKAIASQQRLSQQINTIQRDIDRRQQHIEFVERQQTGRTKDIERLKERIAELEASLGDGQSTIVKLEQSLGEARIALEAMPIGEVKQQRGQLQQQIAATRTIVDGRRAVVDSRRATLGQIENRLMRQRQRQQSLRNQQEEINLDKEESNLRELQKRMQLLDDAITPLRSLYSQIQGELSDVEADFGIWQKDAHTREEAYTEARVTFSTQQNSIDNMRERIATDLGVVQLSYDEEETAQTPLPIDEVVETLPVVDELPEGIDENIRKRRGQMQRMGAINPDAPEEYRTTLERHEFLTEQIADLLQTEEQLRVVIADLDELTSQEFAKTVAEVNVVFSEMFTRLFGGGSAELVLTNPDDLTVSGVDIMARLPRRRVQGLGLLSGGERSLTAAALIFSLLKVTPPPFCMMDEVDAALDEANVNRFRDALRELAEMMQIVVITHNRGTVQAANTIYGISMSGDSTSQVISIKPEDYVQTEIFE